MTAHPNMFFSDILVNRVSHQKHLGIYPGRKLSVKMHIRTVLCKVNKSISIIKEAGTTKKMQSVFEALF